MFPGRKSPRRRLVVISSNKFSKYPYFYFPSDTIHYQGVNRLGAPLLPFDLQHPDPNMSENVRRDTDDRVRRRETEEERDDEQVTCPECGGQLETDTEHGETVCADCGLVVETDEIDRGPEWRAFDSKEKDEKSRVGAPTTKMMHDKGLSTNIGWQDKDAYGKALSSRQREKMQRLRTWNERFRTRDSKERNLKQALGEIDRMASALGLPENVRETASVIYRRALDEDLLPGRSIEGVATAALYAAARQAGTPRSLDEIAAVSRVEKDEIARTYRYVVRELKLEIQPADPESYVPRFASDLGLSEEAERRARQLLKTAKDQGVHSGKSPVGLAAAAVYAAALLTNEKVTQNDVSEVANISEVTIRNRYHELLEAEEEVQLP
ncbi:transcription initiation factor TFIIB [Halalkaliarchaeum desulfuricum]|uniref:Transcription initiation factor IIB n=2 Tax=Halalkaliarchaeum desulfuricum TaxID=2055893 RepID=A0A343TMD2_9EURY|nr:transcription initiation factor TFIIB [Halalkaliarchaeum desulfuricum]